MLSCRFKGFEKNPFREQRLVRYADKTKQGAKSCPRLPATFAGDKVVRMQRYDEGHPGIVSCVPV